MRFVEFKKIPRLSRDVIITEKIDGTNGQLLMNLKNSLTIIAFTFILIIPTLKKKIIYIFLLHLGIAGSMLERIMIIMVLHLG
jgi:hypothetical protein